MASVGRVGKRDKVSCLAEPNAYQGNVVALVGFLLVVIQYPFKGLLLLLGWQVTYLGNGFVQLSRTGVIQDFVLVFTKSNLGKKRIWTKRNLSS